MCSSCRYLQRESYHIPERDEDHKKTRNKEYPVKKVACEDLPACVLECRKQLLIQLNGRFLHRFTNKFMYIATVMDPRNNLESCFALGDAMSVDRATALYTAELTVVARKHYPEMLVAPVPPRQAPIASTSAAAPSDINAPPSAHAWLSNRNQFMYSSDDSGDSDSEDDDRLVTSMVDPPAVAFDGRTSL